MNNTLSKEECLNKYDLIFYEASADIVEGELEKVAKAMDEYAKQESRGFFKWYGVKMVGFIEYIKDIRPIVTSNEIEEKLEAFEGKTFEELFNLYETDKQNKEQ